MGAANSKVEGSNALRLCKERKKFIKQAIDSRYALAAAHVSYVQSLRNIGIALRRYAEAEVFVENYDKTPSHSSYHSPSPSNGGGGGTSDSPLLNQSPLTPSPSAATVSYMRSSGVGAVTVSLTPNPRNVLVEEGEFSMPPPPPPFPEGGGESSWDFFQPANDSFRFFGQNVSDGDAAKLQWDFGSKDSDANRIDEAREVTTPPNLAVHPDENASCRRTENEVVNVSEAMASGKAFSAGNSTTVEKDVNGEREDPSEFITHRAKDFLSSIKDIDNRFFRASESGKEVSRMLEANKIRVGYEARGKATSSNYFTSFGTACCRGGTANPVDEDAVTKVITWKRTSSSRSSSSRARIATKDNSDDSSSDFVEDMCMISGSHSSTLERIYAWERKLYDEVKASEAIQKQYDSKCEQLRHQFAKDFRPQIIDKTRAAVKDLHSRIQVALHAVGSISKRIEKMRDEELLPQLLELIQGLTGMWKAMLECHHLQYITISLAYHHRSKDDSSTPAVPPGETQRQIIGQLLDEVEFFGLSFSDWIDGCTRYVEAVDGWQHNCILQQPSRGRRRQHKGVVVGRGALSPRRYLAPPPAFVLCSEWSGGIKSLPSQEVRDAVAAFLSELRSPGGGGGGGCRVSSLQGSLSGVLDKLTKFSEASVKMYEQLKCKCESASNAYDSYMPLPPRSVSIP
ncbi:hypothetical protein M569_14181 [Genlisea aurea]|uniref:DUF632 domain-containing protein n=1 Tax=Genlisea aurea TaxID=192259 RepID=S8C893_9LAMI|nr:hypothetical protein M569_14181 [Genlisea aurea]